MNKDWLDARLERRRFEAPSSGLADRIIAASHRVEQRGTMSLGEWLRGLFTELLPQPAYVLASVLVVGIMIGITAAPQETDNEDVTGFAALATEEESWL